MRLIWRATLFALGHALAVAGLALLSMHLREQALGARALLATALLALGALAGGFVAWLLAWLLATSRPPSARFALMLVLIVAATAGFAGLFHFVQYRSYFATFHFVGGWRPFFFQNLFTAASATFTLVASGLPLLLPLGLPLLLLEAALFTRASAR